MNILLSGSNGLIGRALLPSLRSNGYEVIKLLRTPQSHRKRHVYWNTDSGEIDTDKLEDIKGVIHLAGENINNRRWTDKQKQRIKHSRIEGTRQVAEAIANLPKKPLWMLVSSAVGYYGNRGDTLLEENAEPGKGFLAETVINWEAAAQPAIDAGIRVIFLRKGMVLSREGGALQKMRPLFNTGFAGKLGNGKQYISWITLHDVLRATLFLIEKETLSGAFNITAPYPVTNTFFTRILAQKLKRPALLPAPSFALRAALGEMADELLLTSTRAIPRKLDSAGFVFNHPTIEQGLKSLL